jgi:Peptidase inhibitor family I36
MRKPLIVVVALAIAVSIGLFAAGSAAADETCPSGNVCVWPQRNFQGTRGLSLCTGGVHPLAGYKESVKNRCANKSAILRKDGVWTWCIGPAENANVPPINEVVILAEGAHC